MKKKSIRNRVLLVAFLLVIATGIQGIILGNLSIAKRENKVKETYIYGQNVANSMRQTLENALEAAETLRYFYEENPTECINHFDSIAENIYNNKPIIASMYIAPKGVIQVAYPEEVNSSTIGFDMLNDPEQGPRARLAVETKSITVAGPHQLVEGGVGFIVRNPIFDANGEFLAFTIIVLDWDKFGDRMLSNLSSSEQYKIGIWKDTKDETAVTDDEGYILRNTDKSISKKVDITLDVPNDVWHINVEPVNGWYVVKDMAIPIALSVIISSALILVIFLVYVSNDRKKKLLVEQGQNEATLMYMEQLTAALEKAKKADAAKTSFLSKMSHDIRTPLNGIIGLIEINEKHSEDKALVDENRAKAKVAANHLLSLISDILEISKMDDENVQLTEEAFNILDLAEDVITIASMHALEAGIHIEHMDCSKNVLYPYIYGSPLHLRQILLNLFSNAIKYNKPNGSVSCKLETINHSDNNVVYCVTVSDTGIGMSEEFLAHIFEPFSQERNDARSVYHGTGLGMAIVKSLVDKMNGNIQVESVVDEGTTFKVTIPFRIAHEVDVPKQTSKVLENLNGISILVAEDNELNRDIMKTLLTDLGASVDCANNGEEAIEKFTSNPIGTYDVILMDLMMPKVDGFMATKAIREFDRCDAKEIPIIAMTANAFAEDAKKCIDAGMNLHLAKPIEISKLLNAISTVVNKK